MKLTRVASKYREMQSDGRLQSNKPVIELLDARIEQLLERLEHYYDPERLKNLERLWKEYQRANDIDKPHVARRIDAQFEAEFHDYNAWDQMLRAMETRRKQLESEIKIIKELNAILTAEDAYDLMAKAMSASMAVLTDPDFENMTVPKRLKRLQYEYTRIIGEGLPESTGTGDREAVIEVRSSPVD